MMGDGIKELQNRLQEGWLNITPERRSLQNHMDLGRWFTVKNLRHLQKQEKGKFTSNQELEENS